MKPVSQSRFGSMLARASIWSIVNHTYLVGQIRIYMWSASATVLLLSAARIIPLQVALHILLVCGCAVLILLWSLISWRKRILLGIQDQSLRQVAHAAMLALIRSKGTGRTDLDKRPRWIHRPFNKRSHS